MFDDDNIFVKIIIGSFIFMLIIVLIGAVVAYVNFHKSEPLSSKAEQGLIRYEDLSYEIIADEETHIMYYKFSTEYMCPYYSTNGKLCRYENGKIIEVNADEDSD